MRYFPLLLTALLLVGCGASARQYQVFLKNETPDSLTIGLVKNGGPYQEIWSSPEDLAIADPQGIDRLWGVIVPPGKTANTPMVKGKLGNDDLAFLRIYSNGGEKRMDFSHLLAISHGEPNRLDLLLHPGSNAFIIRDETGVLHGQRIDHSTK